MKPLPRLVPALVLAVSLACDGPALAFKAPVHGMITWNVVGELGIDPQLGAAIVAGSEQVDGPDCDAGRGHLWFGAGWDDLHFNDCAFAEASQEIRRLGRLVSELRQQQKPDEAARQFGRMLHILQDFYGHSNYVESDGTSPLDSPDAESTWPQLEPYVPVGSLMFIEGPPPPQYALRRRGFAVDVLDARTLQPKYRGIVTGAVGGAAMACPRQIAVGHWDDAAEQGGLHKDGAGRDHFPEAVRLASAHTFRAVQLLARAAPDWFGQPLACTSAAGGAAEHAPAAASPCSSLPAAQPVLAMPAGARPAQPGAPADLIDRAPSTGSLYQSDLRWMVGIAALPSITGAGTLRLATQYRQFGVQATTGYRGSSGGLRIEEPDGGLYVVASLYHPWENPTVDELRSGAELGYDWRPVGNLAGGFLALQLGASYWVGGPTDYPLGVDLGAGRAAVELTLAFLR